MNALVLLAVIVLLLALGFAVWLIIKAFRK
jgi:hypothetical protein